MCETQGEEVAALIDTASMTSGIVKEVNRITDILDELLMVGRIESGKIKFDPVQVDVKEYIDTITRELFLPHQDGRNLQQWLAQPKKKRVRSAVRLLRYATPSDVRGFTHLKLAPDEARAAYKQRRAEAKKAAREKWRQKKKGKKKKKGGKRSARKAQP